MKRIFALVLALCLVLAMVPAVSAAQGVCGADARWSYSGGVITVSGTGAMWDFRNDADYFDYHGPRPWEDLHGEIRKVVIEDGITEVGANAFAGLEELTEVELPDSLLVLDAFAFNYCPKLTGVVLPGNLQALGQQAFAGSAITTIDIPASVSFLDNAFVECTSLTNVIIRSDPSLGAFVSGSSPFSSCTSLTAIEVEEGHCALVDFDGVLYVKNGDYYQLQQYPCARPGDTYEIVEGTLTIEQFAMHAAVYPETVIVPAGVEYIGYGAFSAYTPDHVNGPQGVKNIYFRGSAPQLHEGFAGTNLYGRSCTAYYPAGDASWDSVITGNFGDGMTWMPYTDEIPTGNACGDAAVWSYANGTLSISGTGAMWDFQNDGQRPWEALANDVRKVVIGDGITSIGAHAFGLMPNLTSVTFPESLLAIKGYAFFNCDSLAGVVFPRSLQEIGDNSFTHCRFTELEIPASVTFLGASAFDFCSELERVTIRSASNLPYFIVGNSPFRYCTSLTDIVVEDGHLMLHTIDGILYAGNTLMQYPLGRKDTTWEIPAGTVKLEKFCAAGSSLKTIIVPDFVEEISDCALKADVETIYFRGNAPVLGEEFTERSAEPGVFKHTTCYYPVDDASWDSVIAEHSGGLYDPIWVPYNPANPFTDVPLNAFYEEAVLWAVEQGVTNGTSDTAFSPAAVCNRATVVTFLWRAAGAPEPETTEHPFVDVAKGSFFEKAVLWAVENGITNGVDATHFGPAAACNRATVVTFLYRAMGEPAFANTDCPFTDVAEGAWYEAPILWAVENGVTNGMGDGAFGVAAICNRAQVVTFLHRTYVN